jgi:hypothetical protein
MALSDNPFIGLPLATLQQMQATWLQVLNDIATVGQSYTFPNRSLTKANLPEVVEILTALRYAISDAMPGISTNAGKQIAQAIIDTQSRFAR